MLNWGASASDWTIAADLLGLTGDLLPVVARPDAKIKATSSLKSLGKTPSLYSEGKVVGVMFDTSQEFSSVPYARWRFPRGARRNP
jgi:hypothetical protein